VAEAATAVPAVAEAQGWLGFEVDDVNGAHVGRARSLFVDAEGGAPAWLIVALRRRWRRFSRRRDVLVALPLRDCAGAAGRVWIAHRADSIRSAPTVDPTRPLLREHELAICAHFGVGERVGRAAEVAGRPAGSLASTPALGTRSVP